MKKIIKESGIRNIRKIAEKNKKAKIYYHQDLDGVTTALAMKKYLEQYGIETIDAEYIQYGEIEYAIQYIDIESDTMAVLVDFAHSKVMFKIHTDHHDTQSGVEQDTATSFRPSRSNVKTISEIVSPQDIFTNEDIEFISMVDSANFLSNQVTVDEVINYIFKIDKEQSLKRNKTLMGLVVNKLLLAFKNKPGFLNSIVMNAQPSLISVYNVILSQMETREFPKPEELQVNKEKYIEAMKTFKNMRVEDGVIVQYGGGSMIKPGSYDRYTPFKNNPDANFLVIAWPTGIVQASCNPFKKKELSGINLGDIRKDEVMPKFESDLKNLIVTFGTLKRISEGKATEGSVGFRFKDLLAIYGNRPSFKIHGGDSLIKKVYKISDKLYRTLRPYEKDLLDKITVNGWDIVEANSGGHKDITNISGLNYLYRGTPEGKEKEYMLNAILNFNLKNNFIDSIKENYQKYGSLSDKQIETAYNQILKYVDNGKYKLPETPRFEKYTDLIKGIQEAFVEVLKEKLKNA